jgi:hypothetical protein
MPAANRPVLAALLSVTALWPAWAEDKEAWAIVERAIKAQGGEAKLARTRTCSRREAGTLFGPGKDIDLKFTAEVVRNLPGQVRSTIDFGKALRTVVVLDSDTGWVRSGGPAAKMVKEYRQELREQAYIAWLATLVPLKDPAFALKVLPDTKLNSEPAAALQVSRNGHADATLYFLKSTGLLAKIAQRTGKGGASEDKEYLFSAYKEFDGVNLPTLEQVNVNGKKKAETTVTAYKFLPRPDPSAFTRP